MRLVVLAFISQTAPLSNTKHSVDEPPAGRPSSTLCLPADSTDCLTSDVPITDCEEFKEQLGTMTESATPRNHMLDRREDPIGARTVPILEPPIIKMSAPSPGEPMDVTTPTTPSAPASTARSPETEANGNNSDRTGTTTENENPPADTSIMPAPVNTTPAPAVHQPKIVQTAFIHKLYNMLEDSTISHLISWSPTNDSFVMTPSHDFAKVLAQYFKHTNISSFVRQLNMYGFHKVSDVFHHGGPETAMWEFKHGNNNFKRGDLVGLREIKRRASRHALVHRDYSSTRALPSHVQTQSHSQPVTPAEPMPTIQQPPETGGDPRSIESTLYDLSARLQRSEENAHYMHVRQQAMLDTMTRILHFNQEITRSILNLAPGDHPIHRDVQALQGEIQRQADMIRGLDEPLEPLFNNRAYYDNQPPVSPRQLAVDDSRRNSLSVPQQQPPRPPPPFYRPSVPSNLSVSTGRRPYGSIGGSSAQSSPSSLRPTQIPPPPPGPHPLANVELPPGSLARRHTSADIRAHGWQSHQQPPPPFPSSSGPPSSHWPSSPNGIPGPEDRRIRESLSSYSLQSASSQPHARSRPNTPPPPSFHEGTTNGNGVSSGVGPSDNFGSWSWNKPRPGNLAVHDTSAPPTRRGSMAHILNPTDTSEREGEEDLDIRGEDDRKRKRLQ